MRIIWKCKNCGKIFTSWSSEDAECPICGETEEIEEIGVKY